MPVAEHRAAVADAGPLIHLDELAALGLLDGFSEVFDPGEVSALALWLDHRDAVLLCDDLAARRKARDLGCEVAGTLGVLLWAGRSGRVTWDEARSLVEGLVSRSTLHLSSELVRQVVGQIDGWAEE